MLGTVKAVWSPPESTVQAEAKPSARQAGRPTFILPALRLADERRGEAQSHGHERPARRLRTRRCVLASKLKDSCSGERQMGARET